MPIFKLIEAHVLAAERLHGDDTTVPVKAKSKTETRRSWNYVRDDRPFGGVDPPAVIFHFSRDQRGEHPRAHLESWAGILQADAYAGYGELYASGRQPGIVLEAGCFAHARRNFNELADVEGAARKKSRGKKAQLHLSGRPGGRAKDRCAVRHRAGYQRQVGRCAARSPSGVQRPAYG